MSMWITPEKPYAAKNGDIWFNTNTGLFQVFKVQLTLEDE